MGDPAWVALGAGDCGRVDPLDVIAEHAAGRECRSERPHRGADAGQPGPRQPVRVAFIEGGRDLLLKQAVESAGVASVLRPRIMADVARERPPVRTVVASAHQPSSTLRFRPPLITAFIPLVPLASSGGRGRFSHTSQPRTSRAAIPRS